MSERSYYEVLGVEPDAGFEEIRRAYKRKVRQVHPDHGGSDDQFAAVQEAFDVLSDYKARVAYDARVSSQPSQQPAAHSSAPWGTTETVPAPAGAPHAAPSAGQQTQAARSQVKGGSLDGARAKGVVAGVVSLVLVACTVGGFWLVDDSEAKILVWLVLMFVGLLGFSARLLDPISRGAKGRFAFLMLVLVTAAPLGQMSTIAGGWRSVASASVWLATVVAWWIAAELMGWARRTASRPRRVRTGAYQWDLLRSAESATGTQRVWVLDVRRSTDGQYLRVADPNGIQFSIAVRGRSVGKCTWIVLDGGGRIVAQASDFARQAWSHLYAGAPAPR